VKSLVISFTIPTPESLEAFYDLLNHLEVEKVRTNWVFGRGGWQENETREIIERKQPKLKSFVAEAGLYDLRWSCW